MSNSCEYCGVDLPLGVDKRTRRVRSFHFASCEKRPRTTPHSPDIEAQRDALRAELKEATEAINDPAVNNLRTLPESIRMLCAQRDALKQTLHDELDANLRLRDLGGARPDEPMLTFLQRIIAERDALLRALKSTGLFLHHCWCDVQMNDYSFEKLNRQMEIVDAAIKMVEEGK